MASWNDVCAAAPELAATAQTLFDAYTHKTLATLRKDGSPRISATEVNFIDGELWLGALWQSRKALDLQRDPRFALHGGTGDATSATWQADVKLAGRVEEIVDPAKIAAIQGASGGESPPGPSHLFRADISELVVTRLGDPPDHLAIEVWREGQGVRRFERR